MNCRSIHLSLNPFKHSDNFFTTDCILGLCMTLRINNGYSAKHSFIVEILRAFIRKVLSLHIHVTRNPCQKMSIKMHILWTRTNMPKIVSCHETGRTFPPSSSVSVNFNNSRLMTDNRLNHGYGIIEQRAVNTIILFIEFISATCFNHKGTPSG